MTLFTSWGKKLALTSTLALGISSALIPQSMASDSDLSDEHRNCWNQDYSSSLDILDHSHKILTRLEQFLNEDSFKHIKANKKEEILNLVRIISDLDGRGEHFGIRDLQNAYSSLLRELKNNKIFGAPDFYLLKHKNGCQIYLLGSQHNIPLDALNPEVKKRIYSCGTTWLESLKKQDPKESRKLHDKLVALGYVDASFTKFEKELTPEAHHELSQIRKMVRDHVGLDTTNYHPLALELLMLEFECYEPDFIVKAYETGMDNQIEKDFRNARKQIQVLESISSYTEDQGIWQYLEANMSNKDSDSVKRINQMIEARTQASDSIDYLSRVYLDDICYTLGLLTLGEISHLENIDEDDALKNRNIRWHGVLDNALNKGMFKTPQAICVGVAHLPGETGLIKYFRNKGFEVEAMDFKGNFQYFKGAKTGSNSYYAADNPSSSDEQPQQPHVLPADFNGTTYVQLNGDLVVAQATSGKSIEEYGRWHYINFGRTEGRTYTQALPADFNPKTYVHLNGDLLAAQPGSGKSIEDFGRWHYTLYGKNEGRKYK